MTLDLKSSLAVSLGAHLLAALLALLTGQWLRTELPPILEITLVSGPGGGGAPTVTAGQQAPPERPAEVKAIAAGQVSVASPEFVSVGKRPQRTEETPMGIGGTGARSAAAPGGGEGPGGGGGSGRKLRYQEPLEYPDWAKQQAIDARVTLRFKVLPDGSVDSGIVVRRTSGWRKLDELAIRALRNFLFEPLPADMPRIPQWGELSFHFKPE